MRALQAGGQFKVRALSRNPAKHRDLADEVVEADLDRPETLKAAFQGVHGVFLVTNFWEEGTDERKQATAAVHAAKDAGVKHFDLVHAAECRSDQRRQVRRSPLYRQGEDRSDRRGSRVCASHVRHRALLLPGPCGRSCAAKAGRRIRWAGRCLSIPLSAAFTWAISTSWATSLPEPSHIRIRQAMASTCRSSAIS